jgi:hypothetical protein
MAFLIVSTPLTPLDVDLLGSGEGDGVGAFFLFPRFSFLLSPEVLELTTLFDLAILNFTLSNKCVLMTT